MQKEPMNLLTLNARIYKNAQGYLDKALKEYELSSGSFRYLFVLEKNEGICQNRISELIGNDKAMSTRIIVKLIELEYVRREGDEKDSRAYKLYLTKKAKLVIPKIRQEITHLIDLITEDLIEEEKEITMSSFYKILTRIQGLNE